MRIVGCRGHAVLLGALLACAHGAFTETPGAAEGGPPQFNRDILPILSNNCFACHGPDGPARKGGVRLDDEDAAKAALASGGVPIVPGDPLASLIMRRILSDDPGEQMPPPETGKALTEGERGLLERWIAGGAVWQPHWAYIPPVRPELPAVADTGWPRNAIDHFALANLEAEGIAPSPEADRHTLIRRVSLDLTGLPPTPGEVAAFVGDPAPDAYERAVDRLLASPRYGEHLARHWLDIARYADTNGYAADIERTMWRYRDWVIDALNANMPFDQFTVEQLAGDLLPEATLEQRIATGFNRNHPIMMEGGAIFEEFRVQNVVDRADTTSTAWLGLTMKCAQCHDHKYDPLSQKEFFQFYAYFNNVAEEESQLFGTELDGNSLPRIKAPLPAQRAAIAKLEEALAAVRAEKLRPEEALDAAQDAWEEEARAAVGSRWTDLDVTPDAGGDGDSLTLETSAALPTITALRIDVHPPEGDSVALSEVEIYLVPEAEGAEALPIPVAESAATDGNVKGAHDGKADTAWQAGDKRSAVFAAAEPFESGGDTHLRLVLRGEGLALRAEALQFRISDDPAYLPATLGPWQVNGPHVAPDGDSALADQHVDPSNIDLAAVDGDGEPRWKPAPEGLADGKPHGLPGKTCATWFHRNIAAPSPRTMDLALDNRNAVRLWVNGRLVLDKAAQRGEVGPHPAPLTIELDEGENSVVMQLVDYYDFNAHTFFFARRGETVGPMPLDVEQALSRDSATQSDAEKTALRSFYRSRHWDRWPALHAEERDRVWELAELDKTVPTTMVMEDLAEPRPTHVLVRGQYDLPGEAVSPGVPAALHPWPEDAPKNRLGLAQWLVAPDNPLTARVAVNRDWQRYFGAGIVRTADDFGAQGEWPSHPQLLDWLAREFIESGWNIKAMQRLIVTSATYRQASRIRPELAHRDPENRLLARGPRYRLDAEQIRDNALAASGLLAELLGGPSVKPYQPPGLWRDVAYGGGGQRYTAQEFIQDHGDKLYRRSLYTFWKRAAAPPGMLVFDAPNREVCVARRTRSNTPLQALALMNDVQYVEAARAMAERILKEGGADTEARMDYASVLLLARPARPAEREALRAQFEAQVADYRTDLEAAQALLDTGESDYDRALDPAEFAAWTLVANALMNTDAAVTQF